LELLHLVIDTSEQERRAQHGQRVGDERAGNGRLHQSVLSGTKDRLARNVLNSAVADHADQTPGPALTARDFPE